jgi:hypothetical protein
VLVCGLLGVLAGVCVVGLLVDDRMLVGAPIWLKPLKFCISIFVFGATLAWLLPLLHRTPRLARYVGNVVAGSAVIEIVLLIAQVVRGQQSHFNHSTPLNSTIFMIMGVLIVTVWCCGITIALAALWQRVGDRVQASALRLGLALSVGGMVVGFLMTCATDQQREAVRNGTSDGITGAHSVGVPDGGPGLPVTGWSTTGGDLRVAHFVGIHGLQVIPLVALLLATGAGRSRMMRSETVRRGLVRVAGAGYGGLIMLLVWQAERGQSLIHPDGRTGVAAGLLLGSVLAAAGLVVRVSVRSRGHLEEAALLLE